MSFEVVLTKKAERDLHSISKYIKTNFGENAAESFGKLVFEFAELIQSFPEMGSIEIADKKVRGLVVHRRLKAIYRIKGNQVVILRMFDTRQHPDKKL